MNEVIKELLKRAGVLFLILGLVLIVLAANRKLPIPDSLPFEEIWVTVLAVTGGMIAVAGFVMVILDWRASQPTLGGQGTRESVNSVGALDAKSIQKLENSGLVRAFRIPSDNGIRLERVCHLIEEEVGKGEGQLRLTASSGHSYLNPNGPVWKSAEIGKLIESGKIRQMEVILESPFTSFAETRAVANKVKHHQWEEKQIIDHLISLLRYPNINLRVTSESITCSLFITSRAVYYDPYLWSLTEDLGRTENNFWVLEFDKVTDPKFLNLDCYSLLERHFEFLRSTSIALEQFLYKPGQGAKAPRKEQFLRFFEKSPELALNNYNALTAEFHERIKKRMKER